MAILTTYPRIADPYRQGSHAGLNFAYGIGSVRDGVTVTRTNAGAVALADNAVSYVEAALNGVVSANTTSYTAGRIPLYTVTTASGAITVIVDDRCFLSG